MKHPVGIGSPSRLFLTGLIALLISAIVATGAGVYLGSESELLKLIPGLMVLLPPSISMRGSISGVLASRLSSSMHLGAFEVDFGKESVLGANLRASFIITVIIAFVLGLFAYLVCGVVGIKGLGIIDFVVISVISGVISGFIVIGIALLVTLGCYRYGLDLDMIASPTVTTSGDLVTLPILVISAVALLQLEPMVRTVLFAVIFLAFIAGIVYSFFFTESVRTITKEIVPLLIPLSMVGTFAGLTYALDLDRLVAFAVFLILIPPFTGVCGSIAGILSSRLATGMHTGGISPGLVPEREVISHFISTYAYAIVVLPILGIIAHTAAHIMGLASPGLVLIIFICTGAGLVIMTLVNIMAYTTASLSFRYGLDPDNFGIPVITSLIDLAGAAVLMGVINILL